MSPGVLYLPAEIPAQILSAAARTYPAECCGLIEGTDVKSGWRALAVHEAANLAGDPARQFLVDPEVQFRLLRSLRGSQRRIIGCYHSHPGGPPQPSTTDHMSAYEAEFLWLIAGGAPDAGFTLRAYLFCEGRGFTPIPLSDSA